MAKATSPGVAVPCAHAQTMDPVRPACRSTSSRFWPSQTSVKRFQVTITASRQAAVTLARRSASRRSAPKLLTVGLEVTASARAPPMRESRALDRRLLGRT